ncbi:MAG: nickel-dependent lactate racemase [Phycisphaerae bacterium]|nr:nickel-dependent lactate racemase [Phycisphaerae bacterium]
MPSKKTYLLYDRSRIEFDVPAEWAILEPHDPPAITDIDPAVRQALAVPIGAAPLLDLARRADRSRGAVVVISDITRAVPNRLFLPIILETLETAGFTKEQIVILVATGMHRPSTRAEHVELVGQTILDRYRIVDHRADAPETLVALEARTSSGTAVQIDAVYANAGLRILTGFIEPHLMAGFSGGRKSICPGLVDLDTVQKFHGPHFVADPRTATGILDGNPCHREALEVARIAKPDFIFNVTVDADSQITGIFTGDLEAAHAEGVRFVEKHMAVTVPERFDTVFVSGGGYPLDTTFYQTVKGMVAGGDFVRQGGTVITVSGCRQGFGSDNCRRIMFEYADDYQRFLRDIFARDRVEKDQWEFQLQTRVLEKTSREGLVLVADGIDVEDQRRCHVTPAFDLVGRRDAAEAVKALVERTSQQTSRVAVLPRGPYILPRVGHG